jgi:hypothetical protein
VNGYVPLYPDLDLDTRISFVDTWEEVLAGMMLAFALPKEWDDDVI